MSGTVLERRYRRLLRVLPPAYRVAWQEEMVTTFLESMRTGDPERDEYLADYGRPSVSEAASVVSLAIRLRLPAARMRRTGAVSDRDVVLGDAARIVGLTAMLVHATSVASLLLIGLWLHGRTPWLAAPPPESGFVLQDPWLRLAGLAGVLWLPAYLALVVGQRRIARLLAVVAIVVSNAAVVLNPIQPVNASVVAFAAFDALTLVALLGFHRDAPPLRERPWLIALPVGLALDGGAALLAIRAGVDAFPWLDAPAMYCAAAVVAGGVLSARRGRAAPAWILALAVLASAAVGLRVLTLVDYAEFAPPAQRSTLVVLGVVECLAASGVAVAAAAAAIRSLRRRPKPA
jgi:hypothetical protein